MWASPASASGLVRFGVVVEPIGGGTAIYPDYSGPPSVRPLPATGTATWRGGLLGADQDYAPIFGKATVWMDFADTDTMTVSFTDLKRVGASGATTSLPDFPTYTLTRRPQSRWWTFSSDTAEFGAGFYEVAGDPAAVVAGGFSAIDPGNNDLNGTFGAVR